MMRTRKTTRRRRRPLTLTEQRARRATRARAALLTFREQHRLTWEELQALMSSRGVDMTIATLKRFGLAYTTPYATTIGDVERFLDVVRVFERGTPAAGDGPAE